MPTTTRSKAPTIISILTTFVESTGLSRSVDHAYAWAASVLATGNQPAYFDEYIASIPTSKRLSDFLDSVRDDVFTATDRARAAWDSGDAEAWGEAVLEMEAARSRFQALSGDRLNRSNSGAPFGGVPGTLEGAPPVSLPDQLLVSRACVAVRNQRGAPDSIAWLVTEMARTWDRYVADTYAGKTSLTSSRADRETLIRTVEDMAAGL